ncbi:unnamed protein product [Fraxinus pennsylvanica]|uniref:Cytosolic endo-beta-N-acetylglucosaminidase C-terminal domain-containing protein n=1 Tax=Fraxinus pennsylvanica TaxID=56036 RepID=A0AAD2DXC6_9LAMI|nr:unnamed protein product [Fraxinus pennsylvanica]
MKDKTPSRDPSEYYAVLGYIRVYTSSKNTDFPPSASWIVNSHYVQFTSGPQGSKNLSIKIIWQLKEGADQEYLGVAKVECFYISELVVPSGTSSLKFIIQVCSADGASQKLEDSPSFTLKVPAS